MLIIDSNRVWLTFDSIILSFLWFERFLHKSMSSLLSFSCYCVLQLVAVTVALTQRFRDSKWHISQKIYIIHCKNYAMGFFSQSERKAKMLLNKTIWPKSKISHWPLNMKLLDVFAVFVLHDIELPGVHTEHVFNQFRSISHSEVWLNTLHLCIWIFYLQFLFCTILKWSPAARCADHVSHQFCSKRQLIIIFAICVLHFSILHFTFYIIYFLWISQQWLVLH